MEIKWGLVPDMAGCVLLSELCADRRGARAHVQRPHVSGSEALALGLATRVSATIRWTMRVRSPRRSPAAAPMRFVPASGCSTGVAGERGAGVAGRVARAAALIGSANQREAARAGLEKREPKFAD